MTEVRFPADQQEGTEATLAQWLKAPGEAVKAHEPLAEIETDKVMVEVAAPEDGAILEVMTKAGDAVNPGDLLCTFGDTGETVETTGTQAAEESTSEEPAEIIQPATRRRDEKSHGDCFVGRSVRRRDGQRYRYDKFCRAECSVSRRNQQAC